MPARTKIKEWIYRYGPAEILSIVLTLVAAWAAGAVWHNRVYTALAATWGGNLGYFGTILFWDVVQTRRSLQRTGKQYTRRTFARNIRALLVEFGVAEVLDSFLIRPALMYWLPLWLGSLTWGLIAAKVLADVTFYIPSILFYEWSKKRIRKFD